MDIFKVPCPPKGEPRRKSSSFAWIYCYVEVEEIKFGVGKVRRSFPYGEGEGGWGLIELIFYKGPPQRKGTTIRITNDDDNKNIL